MQTVQAKTTVAVTLLVLVGLLGFSLLVIGAYSVPAAAKQDRNINVLWNLHKKADRQSQIQK